MKKYTGAEVLVKALQDDGVDTVFTLPGFFIMDILYYLNKSRIRLVTCKNELSAALAADGYARSSGKTGFVIVNTGPSCLNTVMALKTSQKDGVPVIIIIGTDIYLRMNDEAHFQVVNYPHEITEHKFTLSLENLYSQVRNYCKLVLTNPITPVVLEIPLDVSKSTTKLNLSENNNNGFKDFIHIHKLSLQSLDRSKILDHLVESFNKADRPLLVAGAGVLQSGSSRLVENFIEKYRVPVVTTFCSRGVIKESHKMFVGMPGIIGGNECNKSLKKCDLIIALGTRLAPRFLSDTSVLNKLIFQINVNSKHIRNDLNVFPILCDVSNFMKLLLKRNDIKVKKLWTQNNFNYNLISKSQNWGLTPAMGVLLDKVKNSIIFCDDGTYTVRLWQMAKVEKPRRLLFSGNMASGGHALPGAIGAILANPKEKVVVITGDGALLSNIGELQVYSENNLGVLIVVFNNNSYDSITQWSNSYNIGFDNSIRNADFSLIASGFGIQSYKITGLENLKNILADYHWDHPLLLELVIPSEKVESHFPRFNTS